MVTIRRAWQWLFPTRDLALELAEAAPSAVSALCLRIQPSGWRSLLSTGVVGDVEERRVRLRFQRAWSRNDFAPVFVGHFEVRGDRSYLVGTFGPSRSTKAFLSVWIGFIMLWQVAAFAATVSLAEPGIPFPLVLIVPPLMIGFGVCLARVGARLGRSDADRIESELRSILTLGAA